MKITHLIFDKSRKNKQGPIMADEHKTKKRLLRELKEIRSQNAALERSISGNIVTAHQRKDGQQFPVEITSRLIDYEGEIWILSTVRDISERKQVEKELQRYQHLLDKSQEIAHLGSWEVDVPSGRLNWSDETYRIFGLKPQEAKITYETFLQLIHPEDRDAVDSAYMDSIRMNKDTYEIEHRIIRGRNGGIRTVFEKCYNIRDDSGNIVRSIGMVQHRLWPQPPSLIKNKTEHEEGWAWGQARPTQKPAHQ